MQTAPPPIPRADGAVPTERLEVIEIEGRGRDAGRAYGEASRDLITRHLEVALARLEKRHGLSRERATLRATAFRRATAALHPDLADEVDGMGEGARLPEGGAWVLQLRAELQREIEEATECTSFAALGAATTDGRTLAGQNADLPAFYQQLLVLVRHRGVDPRSLMLTPAGQIGYHGMNEAGVAVFANFLTSDGWRVGVPRYLLTRIALAERSREDALAAVERTPRASPRNMVVADEHGATDVELASDASARIETTRGVVAHSNHHIAGPMLAREALPDDPLRDSCTRLARIEMRLAEAHGRIDVAAAAGILRDRTDAPHAISIEPGERPTDTATVASTIADVRERRLWIAIGPPHLAAYHAYDV